VIARLERVSLQRGGRLALADVSVTLEAGERVGVVGPNGSGKTTLLRVLLGLERPTSGTVTPFATGAGYVPQAYADSLFPWLSVLRNVAMPRAVGPRKSPDADVEARALCDRVLPGIDVARTAGKLSGGEKQATAVARALAAPGDALVADEPFSALSSVARARVRGVLREALGRRTLVLVTHSAEDLKGLCDRVLHVEEGRIVEATA
jgi:ABC-type multidrug transport system ATPase subunit